MKKIDWRRKFGSRKFWAMLGCVALSLGVIFGIPDLQMEQVIALITAVGGMVAYILGESYVDGKHTNDIEPEHTNVIGFDINYEEEVK